MKHFLTISLLSLFLIIFITNPSQATATTGCSAEDIQNFSASPATARVGENITFIVSEANPTSRNRSLFLHFDAGQTGALYGSSGIFIDSNGNGNSTYTIPNDMSEGSHYAQIYFCGYFNSCPEGSCSIPTYFTVMPPLIPTTTPSITPTIVGCRVIGENCTETNTLCYPDTTYCFLGTNTVQPLVTPTPTNVPTPKPGDNPVFCNGKNIDKGINTAIGCIPVGSGNELINAILNIAIGLGGGIALALILYGVFIVTTSAGMPDKLKAGSEIITSAVVGLIFVLLSIFLINLIGINILGIPGLL